MTTSTPSIRRHLEWDRLRQSQAAKYARTTATGDVPQPSDRSDCIEQCASCDCEPAANSREGCSGDDQPKHDSTGIVWGSFYGVLVWSLVAILGLALWAAFKPA